jgi:hypothetical protein
VQTAQKLAQPAVAYQNENYCSFIKAIDNTHVKVYNNGWFRPISGLCARTEMDKKTGEFVACVNTPRGAVPGFVNQTPPAAVQEHQ